MDSNGQPLAVTLAALQWRASSAIQQRQVVSVDKSCPSSLNHLLRVLATKNQRNPTTSKSGLSDHNNQFNALCPMEDSILMVAAAVTDIAHRQLVCPAGLATFAH